MKTFDDYEPGMRVAHYLTVHAGVVVQKKKETHKICIRFDDGERSLRWPESLVLESEYKPSKPSPDQDGEPPPEAAVGASVSGSSVTWDDAPTDEHSSDGRWCYQISGRWRYLKQPVALPEAAVGGT